MYPGGGWWIEGYLGPILSIAGLQPVGLEGVEDPEDILLVQTSSSNFMFCDNRFYSFWNHS